MDICAGYGGFSLGLHLALGDQVRTVCYIEREAFAASLIVARMEDKILDTAPIWDDLTTFKGKPWSKKVDIITAGFPCQPFSVAGKKKGTKDERWIWPDIMRIICEVRPRYVFLENVPGLLGAGLGHVLGDLAEGGYDTVWDCFRASDVGATHKRDRVFVLAYTKCTRRQSGQGKRGVQQEKDGKRIQGNHSRSGKIMADSIRRERESRSRRERILNGSEVLEDASGKRWSGRDKGSEKPETSQLEIIEDKIEGSSTGMAFPPGPADQGRWTEILKQWPELEPALAISEGREDGQIRKQQEKCDRKGSEVEPAVCRVADGVAARVDRLRALGNGVVPAVVALAWHELIKRIPDE